MLLNVGFDSPSPGGEPRVEFSVIMTKIITETMRHYTRNIIYNKKCKLEALAFAAKGLE